MNTPTPSLRAGKHLDLHSGIGGFALAARWTGYETVAFSEIEPYANELLAKRFPRIPNYGDVRHLCRRAHDCIVHPDDALSTGDDRFEDTEPWCPRCEEFFSECGCVGTDAFLDEHGQPDVITSGFPCQDISLNGAGRGLAGARSSLYTETVRIAGELQPPFVVFENVAALKTRGFDRIATDLEALGYAVGTVVVPGYAVGAAHQRERVFAVAHLAGERMEGVWTPGLEESPALARALLPLRRGDGEWEVEPDLRRTPDGLPGRVDRSARVNERLEALGNAIIPQIAAALFDLLPHLARRT